MPPFQIQPNSYSCGTLAVMSAITALGGDADYDTVYSNVGTTSRDGTSEDGIMDGLPFLGYIGKEYVGKNPDSAWRYVIRNCKTHPIIACVDQFAHWIVFTGMIGRRVIAIDSYPRGQASGGLVYDKKELLERWRYRGVYYAIKVSKA